jgi:hypothetical protein
VLVSTQSELAFQVVADWEKAPAGLVHKDVADVTVDAQDRVYLFTRMDPQVVVYDADGNHITTWGRDVFTPRPHGIKAAPNGNIYCVDEFDQTVRVFTPDGQLLQTIGESGIESDTGIDWSYPYANFYERCKAIVRGGAPFNHPTKAAVTRDDHVYVSDGYGNTRIHHFSPTGELLHSWGEPGPEPGNFRAPHCVARTNGSSCSTSTAISRRSGPMSAVRRRSRSTATDWSTSPSRVGRPATTRGAMACRRKHCPRASGSSHATGIW